MNIRRFWLIALPLLLTACGPKVDARRYVGRVVEITNRDTQTIHVTRIVANAGEGQSSCNDFPNVTLAPGQSYSTTFMVCGEVKELKIETKEGNAYLSWSNGG